MNSLHILPLLPFSIINNILMSVNMSNSTFVFFRGTCHANPGAEINFTGSNL